jgi:MazG family protein
VSAAERGIDRLLAVMRRLRNPQSGCPWDIEQSFATIAPYTIEEAYEVADAIERQDWPALPGELGDLLLQVVYYTQMGEEEGRFDFDTVAHGIADKMVERHPHVFGTDEVAGSAALKRIWEERKAQERAARGGDDRVLADVPVNFPALTRALKLQKRAARVGFDWAAAAPILAKVKEEIAELEEAVADNLPAAERALELGDLLFSIVNLARHMEIDPEAALRATNAKFERRFRSIEAAAAREGRTPSAMSLDELEALWAQAKAEERRSGLK